MFHSTKVGCAESTELQGNADFLESITKPVMIQPQTFTDNMFDPTSRGVMNGIPAVHLTGEGLQQKLRQKANMLQQTVFKQIDDQGNSMSYKDLLAGLTYEGESFQSWNNFTVMNYTHLRFCDENGNTLSQRSGGICLQTNKRLLFVSAQYTNAASLTSWGDPRKLPGGYTLQMSHKDTTYYVPIPLRCLRSVEMAGETGVQGNGSFVGVPPSCCGWCELCAFLCCPDSEMLRQWRPQVDSRIEVRQMQVSIGVLMPPWEKKMFANIHIDPNVPLSVTRDFVALLQKNAPGLN
ncbi:uncharacterized protein [Montipora foliosa]|uniref:uncharacterized protein isoform X1 n=3 Tax=Montipora TaxID=46703 RepID=UPI0035F15888